MARRRSTKIIKYKKPWNLNVGVIIFMFIFVYLLACVFTYMSKEKVRIYEVTQGSLTDYADYTALILREETVAACEATGYINYYIRDGRKTGVNDLVYTIDETGRILELFKQNTGQSILPAEDLKEFKEEAARYALTYDPMEFSTVYDMKSRMQSALLEYVNASVLEEFASQTAVTELETFIKSYAAVSGVVCMALDGLEGMTPEQVTQEAFDSSKHPRKLLVSGEQVEQGEPVYKTVSSEKWYLIFQITEGDIIRFHETNTVKLSVKGSPLTLEGGLEIYTGADGNTYGKITLNRYMVQFVDTRYVKIQIETEDVTGLKVPASSVVYKSFYKVPRSYLTADNELLVEVYGEDGSVSAEKVTPVIYGTDQENCYLDGSDYRAGQFILKENSNDRFQLAQTEQLPGIYNVNKGYAVFRKIRILEENVEYCIISIQESAVSIYDHIVLNAGAVTEGQIIYY